MFHHIFFSYLPLLVPLVCREHTVDGIHWFQLHVILRIRVAFVYVTDARGSVVS
jgi:hypothetical protein